MCQEVITETGQRLTTPRQLADYLGVNCEADAFLRHVFSDEEWADIQKENPALDWRDCCLCGVDIEGTCINAGKQVKWDDDPITLLIEG